MPPARTSPGPGGPTDPVVERAILLAVLGLMFVAHVHLVLHQNVNWDEFWFLSFVYDYARGTLSVPRQSFHVHFFGWLTSIEGEEVDQIIAARTVFLVLLIGTCACVFLLARRVASVNGALFAVLCCAAYSNLLYHGTSFRADGLSVFLLMAALVLMQNTTRGVFALTTSAVLVAVALLVTMKSVFFLPVFALVLFAGPSKSWSSARRGREAVAFVGVAAVSAAVLYLWHRSAVVAPPEKDSVAYLQSIATRAFWHEVLFPGRWYFVDSLLSNPIQWAFLVYGVVTVGRNARTPEMRSAALATLALAIPLLSLLVYRNAFPYFYVFVMPPALVLCGHGLDEFTRRRWGNGRSALPLVFVVSLAIAGSVVSKLLPRSQDTTLAQRTIVRAVHEIFPQPVPYIDRNGMIASFPKAGFFMSSWGIQRYREAGRPVFADVLRAAQPKFVLVNSPALLSVFTEPKTATESTEQLLLAEDATVLREHFVPYWGPVYVAGRAMRLMRGVETTWELLLPGAYRLSSDAPVSIGGSLYPPGASVALESGSISLHSEFTQDIVLRTAIARSVPPYPSPEEPVYTGF